MHIRKSGLPSPNNLIINNTMKMFANKFLRTVTVFIALSIFAFSASAQNGLELKEKSYPVGEFSALDISGDFEVTLTKGDYGVAVSVNPLLADYVEVFVRTGELYIKYNEKEVPKEVKKELKDKKITPVFRARVSAPRLKGIELEDNVVLLAMNELSSSDFSLKLEDKAQVKNLSVVASSALVIMNDKSQASNLLLTVNNDLELDVDGNSSLQATVDGKKLTVKAGNNAKATVEATVDKVVIDADNKSNLTLSGKASSLVAKGNRNMNVDARGLPVSEVEAKLAGGELCVKVDKTLDVELSGGAELYYDGKPDMKIRKVMKSTLAPVSEKK